MSKYAHVVKSAGQLINDGLLEKMCANHRHNYGVAIAKDDVIMVYRLNEKPSMEKLKKIQETFKDNVAVICFGDVALTLEEDIQPFSILKNADGDDVCIVALSGNFDRHRKTNESHTAEYLVAKGNLEKRIHKYVSQGLDPAGIVKELDDELTKQDIANLWTDKGNITILFSDGQVCTFTSQEDKEVKFPWGFASDRYGYSENIGEGIQTKGTVTKGFDALKALMTTTKPAETTPQNGTAVSTAVVADKTDTAIPTVIPSGTILEVPDFQFYDTRRKQKSYYESRLGYEPNQFKNAPPLLKMPDSMPGNIGGYRYALADSKSIEMLKHTKTYHPAKDAASTAQTRAETKEVQGPTQTTVQETKVVAEEKTGTLVAPAWLQSKKGGSPKEVGGQQTKTIAASALPAGGNDQAKDKVPASVKSTQTPIIPPDQIQKVQEIMKKNDFIGLFGENMRQIIDPKELKSQIETEIPNFAKRFGLGDSMGVFDSWSYEQWFKFTEAMLTVGKPDVIAKMLFDLSNYGKATKLDMLLKASGQRQAI